jgi:hypothetical protein
MAFIVTGFFFKQKVILVVAYTHLIKKFKKFIVVGITSNEVGCGRAGFPGLILNKIFFIL